MFDFNATHAVHIGHAANRTRGGGEEFRFDNGYGASIIRQHGTRLFELAVIDADGQIVYDSQHVNGVHQWLTGEQAQELLDRIAAAPTRTTV